MRQQMGEGQSRTTGEERTIDGGGGKAWKTQQHGGGGGTKNERRAAEISRVSVVVCAGFLDTWWSGRSAANYDIDSSGTRRRRSHAGQCPAC